MNAPGPTEQETARAAATRATAASDRAARSERLQKVERLLHAIDYKRALRFGRCFRHEVMRIHGLETRRELSRMGLVVSRKVGKATVRNTVKRRLREVFRRSKTSLERLERPIDVIFIPNPSHGPATLAEYRRVFNLFLDWWRNRPPSRNRRPSKRSAKAGQARKRGGQRGQGGRGQTREGHDRGSEPGRREGTGGQRPDARKRHGGEEKGDEERGSGRKTGAKRAGGEKRGGEKRGGEKTGRQTPRRKKR